MFTFKRQFFFVVVVAYNFVSPGGNLFTYLKKKRKFSYWRGKGV